MKKRRINIAVQYAVHSFIVITVTSLMIFLFVGWILQKHKDTVVNNVREDMHIFMQELDATIMKQNTLAQDIFLDELTSPGNIDNHPIQTVEGIAQLVLYQNALQLNDYIFLKYPGTADLIFQEGTISLEGFMKQYLRLDDNSKEAMRSMLENYATSERVILTRELDENVLICCYPFTNGFTREKGIVGFGIEGSTISTYLQDRIQDMPFYALLVDDSGQALFEMNGLSDESEVGLSHIKTQMVNEEAHIRGYITDVYQSVNGLTFYTVMDDTYILSDFHRMVFLVCLGCIAIFIMILALILLTNNMHIKQIRKIRDGLLGLQREHYECNHNEFAQIHTLIQNIYWEQSQKAAERTFIDRTMCELTAKLLLSGKLEKREDILRDLVNIFCPGLRNEYYTVLGIILGEQEDDFIAKCIPDATAIVCREEQDAGSNLFYLIIGMPDADTDGSYRRAEAERLLKKVERQGMQNLFIVTGKSHRKLHEVSEAYQEVLLLTNELLSDEHELAGKCFVFEMAQRERAIEEILEYINANYKDNTLGLDTLAARFHISVSGLSRKIKENMGESWSDYIFRIRLEEACRLLRETEINVRDIPAEVGYSDYSSFSRKFKAKMGVTLKEYRVKEVEGKQTF